MPQEHKTIQPGHTVSRAAASHSNPGGISRATVVPMQKMQADKLVEEELPLQRTEISRGPHTVIQPFTPPRTEGNDHHIGTGQEKEAWSVVQQRERQTTGKETPAMQPGNHTNPVQLMKKEEFAQLTSLFRPQVKWAEFHAGQLAFQGSTDLNNRKEQFDYTTFGTEYEMIPYTSDNAIANTAHIKLAEGVEMPIKQGVKEALVTDSDNVIEYVSPVFVLPLDNANENTTEQVVDGIAHIRKMLFDFKKDVQRGRFANFNALLQSNPMQFTTWQIMNALDISFQGIDENTNVDKLKAFGNTQVDIENIGLGFDNLQKNAKHKELNKEQLVGSAMQSTVLLPLDLVAKIVRESMDSNSEKAQKKGVIQNKAKKGNQMKGKGPGSGVGGAAGELIDMLMGGLRSLQGGNESLLDLVYLFSQRLLLVLEAPNAVKFQAHYQSKKFDPDGEGTIEDPGLLEKYRMEEIEYNEAKRTGKTSEIPNNFHNAHSGIKDRLSVWTRIHMDDLAIALAKNFDQREKQEFLIVLGGFTRRYEEAGSEIFSKIKQVVNGAGQYIQHDPVHFLEENPDYIDLRQDTLRDVQEIDGRPWALVEIRDLKDTTLAALLERGGKVRK